MPAGFAGELSGFDHQPRVRQKPGGLERKTELGTASALALLAPADTWAEQAFEQ
jgi:hypothetical protein